jgi:hypothetical protein
MKYVAFDLEIAKDIPEGVKDWREVGPLGVTCASIVTDKFSMAYWAGKNNGSFQEQMSHSEIEDLVFDLLWLVNHDYRLVTWNGLSFDFQLLAEESGLHRYCADIALYEHIDPMFQFLCENGYPVGLNTVAKTIGLPGKTEGVTGDKAPEMWKNGQQELVIEYVIQDSQTTLDVMKYLDKYRLMPWTTKAGKERVFRPVSGEWLVPYDCINIPLPDTSWMKEPIDRRKFYGWAEEVEAQYYVE